MRKNFNHKKFVTKGGGSVTTTSNALAEIATAVDAVSVAIEVINDIAAQTRFLAMNAAIKAAHAGDYGKDFSTVVDDVRKLAESTAKNAKAISASLANVIIQMQNAKEIEQYLCQHTEK
jgi:methyl-accepting chemotaxis protein